MRAREPLPVAFIHFGKAFLQVDPDDFSSFGYQPIHKRANDISDKRNHAQRKKMQQPRKGKNKSAH